MVMQPRATARATKQAAEKLAAARRLRQDQQNSVSEVVTGNPTTDDDSGESRGNDTKKTLYAQMDAMLTAFQEGKFTDPPEEKGLVAARSSKRHEQLLSRPLRSSADAGGMEEGVFSDLGDPDNDDDGRIRFQDTRELSRCVR
jgi:hypothetical protein